MTVIQPYPHSGLQISVATNLPRLVSAEFRGLQLAQPQVELTCQQPGPAGCTVVVMASVLNMQTLQQSSQFSFIEDAIPLTGRSSFQELKGTPEEWRGSGTTAGLHGTTVAHLTPSVSLYTVRHSD